MVYLPNLDNPWDTGKLTTTVGPTLLWIGPVPLRFLAYQGTVLCKFAIPRIPAAPPPQVWLVEWRLGLPLAGGVPLSEAMDRWSEYVVASFADP